MQYQISFLLPPEIIYSALSAHKFVLLENKLFRPYKRFSYKVIIVEVKEI